MAAREKKGHSFRVVTGGFSFLILILGFSTFPAAAESMDCGPLRYVLQELEKHAVEPPEWTPENLEKLVRVTHRMVDPFELLTLLDEASPDLQKYKDAVEHNNCHWFKKILEEAVLHRNDLDLDEIMASIRENRAARVPEHMKEFAEKLKIRTEKIIEVYRAQYDAYSLDKPSPKEIKEFALHQLNLDQFFVTKEAFSDISTFAIQAHLNVFHDFNRYYSPKNLDAFAHLMDSQFSGIGVQITLLPSGLLIRGIIPGGMAEKEGLLEEGDLILQVGKEYQVADHPINQTIDRLKGLAGTTVRVLVQKRNKDLTWLELTRGKVDDDSVNCDGEKYWPYLYCRFSSFYSNQRETVSNDFYNEVLSTLMKDVISQNKNMDQVDGLILDLRDNPGGSLREALLITSMLTKAPIGSDLLYTKSRSSLQKWPVQSKIKFLFKRLVGLVSEGSASASEIVLGSLQARGDALIVSDGAVRSYGKGSVQNLYAYQLVQNQPKSILSIDHFFSNLESFMQNENAIALKITTAYYYLANGISPDAVGIKADLPIPLRLQEDQREFDESTIKRLPFKRSPHFDRTQVQSDAQFLKELMPLELPKMQAKVEQGSNLEDAFLEGLRDMLVQLPPPL